MGGHIKIARGMVNQSLSEITETPMTDGGYANFVTRRFTRRWDEIEKNGPNRCRAGDEPMPESKKRPPALAAGGAFRFDVGNRHLQS